MLTLSDTSHQTKEILKWGGLFIAAIVVLIVIARSFLFVKEIFFPTPPPKPTVAFGKLPSQVFPKSVTEQNLNYTINTLTGSLPNFSDQTKVFRMQAYTPDLLGLSKAKKIAGQAGFNQDPTKISETLYDWTNSDEDLTRKLRIDIVSFNFSLSSDYLTNPAVVSGKGLDKNQAIGDAQGWLQALNSFPNDIDKNKTQTSLFLLTNGSLTPATSVSNAQIIRVSFYQKDIEKLPVYYENPDSSNINVLIGTGDKILETTYIYQASSDKPSTYPLKTTEQAFNELKEGKGYITSYNGSSSDVSINNVLLAYYISSQTQEFLMPIFVFEGSNDFTAYVPAVTDEWIGK